MSAELLPLVHRGPSPAEDAHGRSRLDLFLDRLSLTPRNTDMLYMADPEPLQHETWTSWLLRRIRPTHSQRNTLLLLAFQTVILVLCYTTTVTRCVVYPLFILSTVFHEFGHALMCVMTGGHVASISVAMDESGLTSFTGGWFCAVLPAGYLGSSLMGALLLFCGFSYGVSRYAAAGIMLVLLAVLHFAQGIYTVVCVVVLSASLAAAFLARDGEFCQHIVLFLGAASSLAAMLDILESTVLEVIVGSDAQQFADHCSVVLPPTLFGAAWFVLSTLLIGASILAGLIAFKFK